MNSSETPARTGEKAVPTGHTQTTRTASLEAFGQPPTEAELTVLSRPAAWRVRGALVRLGLTVVLTPIVAIIPPHAPWVVAVLVGGGILTRRRLTERLTVVGFAGVCPRCGESVPLTPGTRLLNPHPLPCEGCHHSLSLNHAPVASVAS